MTRSASAAYLHQQQQLPITAVDVMEDPMMMMTTEGSSKISKNNLMYKINLNFYFEFNS